MPSTCMYMYVKASPAWEAPRLKSSQPVIMAVQESINVESSGGGGRKCCDFRRLRKSRVIATASSDKSQASAAAPPGCCAATQCLFLFRPCSSLYTRILQSSHPTHYPI